VNRLYQIVARKTIGAFCKSVCVSHRVKKVIVGLSALTMWKEAMHNYH